MASFRYALKIVLSKSNSPYLCTHRLLNYSAIYYDGKDDPANIFINKDVQSLLKALTRVDYEKVFRQRKFGGKTLSDPEYKFMTEDELQQSLKEAEQKADELLQIPPVVKVKNSAIKVLSKDPELQGLESCRMVFTDITYGVKDAERLIVVREPDGTLHEAEWELKQRMNQTYFPLEGKLVKAPKLFQGDYLKSLLDRHEYEYVLDRACIQFEPEDPEYQRVVSIVYQHLNDHNKFDLLRSTRHFGALTFFLVWHRNIDNLLIELIETMNVNEAKDLIILYSIVHNLKFSGNSDLDIIKDYITKAAIKKAALELAIQAYNDVIAQRQELEKGLRSAHGVID